MFLLASCAVGGDGFIPRGGDGSVLEGCVPACAGDSVCRSNVCVSPESDADGDGIPAITDCHDGDDGIGAFAVRLCSSQCGDGVERCTDGVWAACTAPQPCDCEDGAPPRDRTCGRCGRMRQICVERTWTDDGACQDEGLCAEGEVERGGACGKCGTRERRCGGDCTWGGYTCVGEGVCERGASDTETRGCPGGCGYTQTRTRTCDGSCAWGGWSEWTECAPCNQSCGDGTCGGDESCSTCADCRNGHQGTGAHGDSCAGVPNDTWRCVTTVAGPVSQTCRDGTWRNFNLNPRNCAACVCSFTLACCAPGSTTPGC